MFIKEQIILFNASDIIDRINDIPNNLGTIFSNALAFLVMICFALGVILSIIGVIKWATGWDDKGGKKTIVKGIVLVGISLALGSFGFGLTFLPV